MPSSPSKLKNLWNQVKAHPKASSMIATGSFLLIGVRNFGDMLDAQSLAEFIRWSFSLIGSGPIQIAFVLFVLFPGTAYVFSDLWLPVLKKHTQTRDVRRHKRECLPAIREQLLQLADEVISVSRSKREQPMDSSWRHSVMVLCNNAKTLVSANKHQELTSGLPKSYHSTRNQVTIEVNKGIVRDDIEALEFLSNWLRVTAVGLRAQDINEAYFRKTSECSSDLNSEHT